MKRSLCPHCRKRLEEGLRIHHECVEAWAIAQAAKGERKRAKEARAAAKVERAETRQRKEAIKSRAAWAKEAQAEVNKYVRLRDAHLGCASCDKSSTWDGQWHASHFRSVGAASAVRFNLWNIHKACSVCNNWKSGNLSDYEPRLRAKIGDAKVDWLRTQNHLVSYSVEHLKRLKKVFSKKATRLQRLLH